MRDEPALQIREYVPADYAACRALWVELTQHHRDIYEAQSIGGDDPGSDFDDYLALEKRAISWVATVEDEVVGMTGLFIDGAEAEVEPVVVTMDYRSRGIGAQLVQHAIEDCRVRGLASVSVRPVGRNSDALQFFHAAGFRTLGHIELFMLLGDSERTWRAGGNIADRDFST